jgi:hypothetical protein
MDHPLPRSEWFALAANLDRVAGRLGGNPEWPRALSLIVKR